MLQEEHAAFMKSKPDLELGLDGVIRPCECCATTIPRRKRRAVMLVRVPGQASSICWKSSNLILPRALQALFQKRKVRRLHTKHRPRRTKKQLPSKTKM